MIYPLVDELAEAGIPVKVTCRVLKMARQPYYRWKQHPVDDRVWVQAHRRNALLDAHIGHVSQRIRELRALERQLKDLRRRCGTGQAASQCGILAGLAEAATQELPPRVSGHLRTLHQKS